MPYLPLGTIPQTQPVSSLCRLFFLSYPVSCCLELACDGWLEFLATR